MKKQAYLIIVHHQFDILIKTLKILDHERNDFFIHIDKKAGEVDLDTIRNAAEKSNVYFVERMDVKWGKASLVFCELHLLEEAVKHGPYQFYHLISGVDLPLKSSEEILNFFDANEGNEFVQFLECTPAIKKRVAYYHFLVNDRKKSIITIRRAFSLLQTILKVDRTAGMSEKIAYGANWFSITDDLARYTLSKRDWIRKLTKYSFCSDEVFLQTVVINSAFYSNVYSVIHQLEGHDYHSVMRYIDWKRGRPYVWRMDDFEELMQSDYLFARKFDLNTDAEITEAIFNSIIRR